MFGKILIANGQQRCNWATASLLVEIVNVSGVVFQLLARNQEETNQFLPQKIQKYV